MSLYTVQYALYATRSNPYTVHYTIYTIFLSTKHILLFCPTHNFQYKHYCALVRMSLFTLVVLVGLLEFRFIQLKKIFRPSDYIWERLIGIFTVVQLWAVE